MNVFGFIPILIPGFLIWLYVTKTKILDKMECLNYLAKPVTACFKGMKIEDAKMGETKKHKLWYKVIIPILCFGTQMGLNLLQKKTVKTSYGK